MSRPANMPGKPHCGAHLNKARRIRDYACANLDKSPKQIVEALHLAISRECVRQILINNLYRDDAWTPPKFLWRRSNPDHYRRLKLRPVVSAEGTVDLRFERRRAASEFPFQCCICGMGYWELYEARDCCAAIARRKEA